MTPDVQPARFHMTRNNRGRISFSRFFTTVGGFLVEKVPSVYLFTRQFVFVYVLKRAGNLKTSTLPEVENFRQNI